MRTVSTAEFVSRIAAGRIRPVLPMIAQHALATWEKLPDSEKTVRSKSDLIQEGINFAVTHVTVKFNPKQGVKFTTFLYHALENYYADIIRNVYAEKRLIPHGILSLETSRLDIKGKSVRLDRLRSKSRITVEERIINRIDAERMFIRAYDAASPLLRRYLIKWLLQPRVSRNKPGADATIAKREFRKVAKPYLIPELCETIQSDWQCRASIAHCVASRFHTPRKQTRQGFINSEEFAVSPILTTEQIMQLIPTIG